MSKTTDVSPAVATSTRTISYPEQKGDDLTRVSILVLKLAWNVLSDTLCCLTEGCGSMSAELIMPVSKIKKAAGFISSYAARL